MFIPRVSIDQIVQLFTKQYHWIHSSSYTGDMSQTTWKLPKDYIRKEGSENPSKQSVAAVRYVQRRYPLKLDSTTVELPYIICIKVSPFDTTPINCIHFSENIESILVVPSKCPQKYLSPRLYLSLDPFKIPTVHFLNYKKM